MVVQPSSETDTVPPASRDEKVMLRPGGLALCPIGAARAFELIVHLGFDPSVDLGVSTSAQHVVGRPDTGAAFVAAEA